MNNKHTFLTYNQWNGEETKSINLNHRTLSPYEIQNAIDLYIINQNEIKIENERLQKLTDELLNENKALRKFKEWYQNKYDSD